MPRRARLILAVLPLAACMPLRAVDAPGPHTVVFQCRPATEVVVTFARDRARLVEPDGSVIELGQEPAASGFLYGGPPGTLRGQGQEIIWTPAGAAPLTCAAAPA